MPYKKVIAVGDSFTRGDELANCPKQLHEYLFPFQYRTPHGLHQLQNYETITMSVMHSEV